MVSMVYMLAKDFYCCSFCLDLSTILAVIVIMILFHIKIVHEEPEKINKKTRRERRKE